MKTPKKRKPDLSPQYRYVMRYSGSSVFNVWEREYLSSLVGVKYSKLSQSDRAIISRLYSWLMWSESQD